MSRMEWYMWYWSNVFAMANRWDHTHVCSYALVVCILALKKRLHIAAKTSNIRACPTSPSKDVLTHPAYFWMAIEPLIHCNYH